MCGLLYYVSYGRSKNSAFWKLTPALANGPRITGSGQGVLETESGGVVERKRRRKCGEKDMLKYTFRFVTTHEIIFLALCRGPMEAVSSNIEILQ